MDSEATRWTVSRTRNIRFNPLPPAFQTTTRPSHHPHSSRQLATVATTLAFYRIYPGLSAHHVGAGRPELR